VKTALFDFDLPEELIASSPAEPRDSSRMLVVRNNSLADERIRNFTEHLKPNDLVVFNDTRVIPARLLGMRGEAKVEVLLHKQRVAGAWQCFCKPAKRLKAGDLITFANDFTATVLEKLEDGQVLLAFDARSFRTNLQQHGLMPLPPYIEKKRKAGVSDSHTYQTVYAKHDGSVAAPTAGLHFTDELLKAIDATGAKRAHVTLHVGGGTFLPVKAEHTTEHIMHSEWAQLTGETAQAIADAKAAGGRIIAVGTTSLRTLEAAAGKEFEGDTDIFITPGYKFSVVDMLLTNFHLPRSTLFMLVSAFAGLEAMQAAYAHAIKEHYRFYSYGDACLLYRA